MRTLIPASRPDAEEPAPLVHSSAVAGGAAIGLGLAVVAGALWTALAFSDGHSTFYNHLPWWYGTAFLGAAVFGSFFAALFSRTRGPAAGLANGMTVAGIVVVIGAVAALAVAGVNGGFTPVAVHHTTVTVQLIRPYVAFVSALLALGAGLVGGFAGGIIPRPLLGRRAVSTSVARPDVAESASRAA